MRIARPYFIAVLLVAFRQFIHCAHTASTDINGARSTVYHHMTALYIEYKATACAPLRETHVIAMHWLALTNITTT